MRFLEALTASWWWPISFTAFIVWAAWGAHPIQAAILYFALGSTWTSFADLKRSIRHEERSEQRHTCGLSLQRRIEVEAARAVAVAVFGGHPGLLLEFYRAKGIEMDEIIAMQDCEACSALIDFEENPPPETLS